jgi:hypothetical protein
LEVLVNFREHNSVEVDTDHLKNYLLAKMSLLIALI